MGTSPSKTEVTLGLACTPRRGQAPPTANSRLDGDSGRGALPIGHCGNPSMSCRSRAGAADLGKVGTSNGPSCPAPSRPPLPTRRSPDSSVPHGLGASIGARLRLLSLKDAAGRALAAIRGPLGVRHRATGPPSRRAVARLDRGSKEPILPLGSLLSQGKLNPGDPPPWPSSSAGAGSSDGVEPVPVDLSVDDSGSSCGPAEEMRGRPRRRSLREQAQNLIP